MLTNIARHTLFIPSYSGQLYSRTLLSSLNAITPSSRILTQPLWNPNAVPLSMRTIVPNTFRTTFTKVNPLKEGVKSQGQVLDKHFEDEMGLLKRQIEVLDKAPKLKHEELLKVLNKNIEVLEQVKQNQNELAALQKQGGKAAEESSKASSLARKIIIAGISIAIIQDIISVADSVNDMAMTYNKEWHDKVLDMVKPYLPNKIDPEETQWDTMEPYVANKTAVKQAIGDTARTIILLGIALLAKDVSGITKASVTNTASRVMAEMKNTFMHFK